MLCDCFTGLQEAAEAFKMWKEFRDNKEQLELQRESKKPPTFKMVKVSKIFMFLYTNKSHAAQTYKPSRNIKLGHKLKA